MESHGRLILHIISLFSGAGGLDLGLIQAGHNVVWANDMDFDCVQTYEKNIGEHIICKDIKHIDANEIPQADIVVGGFPCQGFSQANMLRSGDDDRNKLYMEYLRIVAQKKPKYFLAENVRGLLSLEKGSAIQRIVNDFSDAGYRVKYRLFNTADFGVPQCRFRVIIVGTRADLDEREEYCYPYPTHSRSNSIIYFPWISVAEALKDVPEPGEGIGILNHDYSKYKITNRDFTGHRTTDPLKPSPTILARGNGKGGVCALQHPRNHRRMSVREQAILQTFPNDFEFIGKLNSCYRQVGNAVPVLFAKALGDMFNNIHPVRSI